MGYYYHGVLWISAINFVFCLLYPVCCFCVLYTAVLRMRNIMSIKLDVCARALALPHKVSQKAVYQQSVCHSATIFFILIFFMWQVIYLSLADSAFERWYGSHHGHFGFYCHWHNGHSLSYIPFMFLSIVNKDGLSVRDIKCCQARHTCRSLYSLSSHVCDTDDGNPASEFEV